MWGSVANLCPCRRAVFQVIMQSGNAGLTPRALKPEEQLCISTSDLSQSHRMDWVKKDL